MQSAEKEKKEEEIEYEVTHIVLCPPDKYGAWVVCAFYIREKQTQGSFYFCQGKVRSFRDGKGRVFIKEELRCIDVEITEPHAIKSTESVWQDHEGGFWIADYEDPIRDPNKRLVNLVSS